MRVHGDVYVGSFHGGTRSRRQRSSNGKARMNGVISLVGTCLIALAVSLSSIHTTQAGEVVPQAPSLAPSYSSQPTNLPSPSVDVSLLSTPIPTHVPSSQPTSTSPKEIGVTSSDGDEKSSDDRAGMISTTTGRLATIGTALMAVIALTAFVYGVRNGIIELELGPNRAAFDRDTIVSSESSSGEWQEGDW